MHKTDNELAISIRDAARADASIIASFNSAMAVETEGHELDKELIQAGVASLLSERKYGRYWIAEVDGSVVGQIMVTCEFSDWRNGLIWWIQSVYVAESMRRKGVYSALHRHVEALAREDSNVIGIRLYVEKDNTRARDTYKGLGMTMTNYRVMEVDFRKQC